jgi:hypothetical protein
VLKLVSYHPIKTFHLDLHRLKRLWDKISFNPFKKDVFAEKSDWYGHLLPGAMTGYRADTPCARAMAISSCEEGTDEWI